MQTCHPATNLWWRSNQDPVRRSLSEMVCVSIQLTPSLPQHSSLSVFTSVFCFLKESTLLASGPVTHAFPFLSLSTFPGFLSQLSLIITLWSCWRSFAMASPPPPSSLGLPAVGVQPLTHLPVISAAITSPFSSGAPTVSITIDVCQDASCSSP